MWAKRAFTIGTVPESSKSTVPILPPRNVPDATPGRSAFSGRSLFILLAAGSFSAMALKVEKPRTVPEAVQALRVLLPDDQLAVIRRSAPDELIRFHFNLGSYIRNLWVHRDGSPLATRVRAAGGRVGEGDELSRLIIEALWCNLNAISFDVVHSAHFRLLLPSEESALQLATVLMMDE